MGKDCFKLMTIIIIYRREDAITCNALILRIVIVIYMRFDAFFIITTKIKLIKRNYTFLKVSSSLPKTSYFKMVDIWLLFCIGMIFIIIIFHAIIDNYLPDTPENSLNGPTAFMRVAPKMLQDDEDEQKKRSTVTSLILGSKLVSLLLFLLFNVSYWGFILL